MENRIACSRCGREQNSKGTPKGQLRLPPQWKRDRERAPVCRDCWSQSYLLRALTFPIAEPLSGSWKELRDDVAGMWRETTAAANWIMTELYTRDARRAPGDDKMPPMPRVYLYPEARLRFPDLPPQSIAALEQSVQRKYRAARYEVIWTGAASLPNARYPQPYPIHVQSWDFRFDDGGRPILRMRLGEGVKWWEVRLKGGSQFRRQLAGLRSMAERGELDVYKNHDGEILCKLVGWIRRPAAPKGLEGSLRVFTGKDSLLIAVDGKEQRIWTENCDHLRRWIAEHNWRIQRLSEDQKAEQRPTPSFAERREAYVAKQRNRVLSAIREVAAHLGNFAARRKFATVEYNDSERGFMGPRFPYYLLADRIQTVLDELGIEFRNAKTGGGPEPETPESLAVGGNP